jgi:drug/metabolite transporter (DMT)-like permease
MPVADRLAPCAKVKSMGKDVITARRAPSRALLGYGACALAATLWGTGFYFARIDLDEMSVGYMVLYRFWFASLGMLPLALRYRVRLTWPETRMLLVCAFLGVPLQFLVQFQGLNLTTVSHAALMVGSMPVMLAAAAALFAGERLDWFGWLALCASTVGVALVAAGGGSGNRYEHPSLGGDLLVLVSLIAALGWILLSKKLMEAHSPTAISAYTILAGTGMLMIWVLGPLALSPLTHREVAPVPFAHIGAAAWAALVIGGLVCTAATTVLWNWGIHRVPASRAGVLLNIEPALGSLLGVELLGERLGRYAWLGGVLILGAAVALTARGGRAEPAVILE